MERVSKRVRKRSLEPFHQEQRPVIFSGSPSDDKEAIAREVATENKIAV